MKRSSSLLSPSALCQSPRGDTTWLADTHSLSLSLPRPLESAHSLAPLLLCALTNARALSRSDSLRPLNRPCSLMSGARKLSTPNNSAWKNASDLYCFTGNRRVLGRFLLFFAFFDNIWVLLVVFRRWL